MSKEKRSYGEVIEKYRERIQGIMPVIEEMLEEKKFHYVSNKKKTEIVVMEDLREDELKNMITEVVSLPSHLSDCVITIKKSKENAIYIRQRVK